MKNEMAGTKKYAMSKGIDVAEKKKAEIIAELQNWRDKACLN